MGPDEAVNIPATGPEAPLVTAIVSTYNSERFLRGCLDDLEAQTIVEQLEIVVINSASEQDEEAIVLEYQERYPNIHYIRTSERETIYAAWNRAIAVARGKYITNANTDDRHRHDAYEVMTGVLEEHPEVGAAYADVFITQTENETFDHHSAVGAYNWLDFTLRDIIRDCFFGPQPMWRKSVHETVGLFRDDYISAGDYDFAIKVGWKCGAIHIRETLGLYVKRPDSVEHTQIHHGFRETQEIRAHYRATIPLEDIYPALRGNRDSKAKASVLVDMGNIAAGAGAADEAVALYERAIGSRPGFVPALHNLALVEVVALNRPEGYNRLQSISSKHPAIAQNLRILQGREEGQLILLDTDHPVVSQAQTGLGVTPGARSAGKAE